MTNDKDMAYVDEMIDEITQLREVNAEMLEALHKVARIMQFGERVALGDLAGLAHRLRQENVSIKTAILRAEGFLA